VLVYFGLIKGDCHVLYLFFLVEVQRHGEHKGPLKRCRRAELIIEIDANVNRYDPVFRGELEFIPLDFGLD